MSIFNESVPEEEICSAKRQQQTSCGEKNIRAAPAIGPGLPDI